MLGAENKIQFNYFKYFLLSFFKGGKRKIALKQMFVISSTLLGTIKYLFFIVY